MKILCDIQPRLDGTVIAKVDERRYEFGLGDTGFLSCHVDDRDAETILSWNGFRADAAADEAAPGSIRRSRAIRQTT